MRLRISLEAKGLRKSGGARLLRQKTSAYAKVCISKGAVERDDDNLIIGRTESVEKNNNPSWFKVVHLDYDPSVNLWIKVHVYDEKVFGSSSIGDKELGDAIVSVNNIYTCSTTGEAYSTKLASSSCGSLKLRAQESHDISRTINLQFRALHVENIEVGLFGLGRTDPFFEIYKKVKHGAGTVTSFTSINSVGVEVGVGGGGGVGERWSLVYRSKYIKDHLNPLWNGFSVPLEDFCDNNLDTFMKIKLLDFSNSSKNMVLGEVETTSRMILESVVERGNGDRSKALEFSSVNPYSEPNTSIGELLVLKARIY